MKKAIIITATLIAILSTAFMCTRLNANTNQSSQNTTNQRVNLEDLDKLVEQFYSATLIEKNYPKSIYYRTKLVLKTIETNGLYDTDTFDDFLNAYKAYSTVTYYSRYLTDDTLGISNMSYEERIKIIEEWRSLENDIESIYSRSYLDTLYHYSLNIMFASDEEVDSYRKRIPIKALTYIDELDVCIMHDRMTDIQRSLRLLYDILKKETGGLLNDELFNCLYDITGEISIQGYLDYAISLMAQYSVDLYDYDSESLESNEYFHYSGLQEKANTELGFLAWNAGDYELLFDCVKQACLMSEEYAGFEHYSLFLDVNELIKQLILASRLYDSMHDHDKTTEFLTIAERLVNEKILCLNNKLLDKQLDKKTKILLYNEIARNNKDYETTERAFSILNKLDTTWNTALVLNQASFYSSYGKYNQAIKLLDQFFEYLETHYVEPRWQIQALECLMEIAFYNNELDLAHSSLESWFNIMESDFFSVASRISLSSMTNYWEKIASYTLETCTMYDEAINSNNAEVSYNAAIFHKGILNRMRAIIQKNIDLSDDHKLKSLYYDYKTAIKTNSSSVAEKERALMYQYSLHPEFLEAPMLNTWKDVQNVLKDGEIAIEFTRNVDLRSLKTDGEFLLGAIILKKNDIAPKIIRLCSESQLEDILSQTQQLNGYSTAYDTYNTKGNLLYQLLWEPLEPELNGVKKIYFAPYSVVNFINLGALQKDEKSKNLFELYEMVRVSSTEEIIDVKTVTTTNAALFGNIDYNNYQSVSNAGIKSLFKDNHSKESILIDENYSVLRSLRNGWDPLVNTKEEIDNISSIMSKNSIKCHVYTGADGSEESFKQLSSQNVSLIHLATHGFYFDGAEAQNIDFFNEKGISISSGLRSGIVFSGANQVWKDGKTEEGKDDGILTADEILGMDLSSTDLLVLSACQSGLGDTGSDGIYGIQRSFKIAGVNTIIMSLWEVDDEATSLMMQSFYNHYLKGQSKREAFKAAQLEVKSFYEDRAKTQSKSLPKYKRYDSSYYWASFIMLD